MNLLNILDKHVNFKFWKLNCYGFALFVCRCVSTATSNWLLVTGNKFCFCFKICSEISFKSVAVTCYTLKIQTWWYL